MSAVQQDGKVPLNSSEKLAPQTNSSVEEPTALETAEQQRRTQLERYAYYAYFFANSGVGPFNYSALLFQNLIYQAGFDPDVAPLGSQPCGEEGQCHVFWAGGTKAYRCPGCDHEVLPGTPHVVAWSADRVGLGVDERRHWHRPCWQNRLRRGPHVRRAGKRRGDP